MTTSSKASRLSRLSRLHARGAALVEAAVVLPVMMVFLGLIMFTHRSYSMKLDKQMGTRAGILYFASHNCEGDLPAGAVPPIAQSAETGGDPLPGGNATDPGRLAGDKGSQDGAAAGIGKSYNLAHAHPADSPVYGKAVLDRRTVPLKRTISAESEVACNEKPFPNKWLAAFEFLGRFAQQGGGLSSK